MGKIKIELITERRRWVGPDRLDIDLEVTYLTEKGYRGTVIVPKEGVTEEIIWEAIMKDSEIVERVLSEEKEVE